MIRLAPSAASVIETDVLDGCDDKYDPASFVTLRAHLIGASALRAPTTREDALVIWDALTELSNAQDAEAQDTRRDPEQRRFARAASRALTTAASRVLRTRRTNEGG